MTHRALSIAICLLAFAGCAASVVSSHALDGAVSGSVGANGGTAASIAGAEDAAAFAFAQDGAAMSGDGAESAVTTGAMAKSAVTSGIRPDGAAMSVPKAESGDGVVTAGEGFVIAAEARQERIVFTDAATLPVFGKCVEGTTARYERLPEDISARLTRDEIRELGRNSAGLYVRFRSNAPSIDVRWFSTFCNVSRNQSPACTRGVDLYILDEGDGEWRFAGCGRPRAGEKMSVAEAVREMPPRMREYMLYLSLYDGVTKLEIGVPEGYAVLPPEADSPRSDAPIVMYGTSILQGGCASRPGLAYTAIISRRLDREVVNLGFSGNAKLDLEIAELMTRCPNPSVYVLDYVPNCSAAQIDSLGEAFFRILRDAHPDVPVIFVENAISPRARFNTRTKMSIADKNAAQSRLYTSLRAKGERNIYYAKGETLLDDDGEDTVDGIHYTDRGMFHYADALTPVISKALKHSPISVSK